MEQFINTKLIIIVIIGGNAAFALTCFFYRAWKGKSRLALPEFDIKFSEKWVSGFSHQSTFTKLGGAANCLAVELSRKALAIRLMFPFSITGLGSVYDLEHLIPMEKIKRIRPEGEGDKGKVIIEFESGGVEKSFELSLKKRQEFLRAVNDSVGRHPVPSGIFT